MGAFCILLALTLTACEGPDSREVDSAEAADAGAQPGMTDAYSGPPMMTVSITRSGELVPTVRGGRTTISVDNTNSEDCNLTLIPQAEGDLTGRSTGGEEAMGAAQTPSGAGTENGTDTEESPQAGANRAGATQGETMQGQHDRVTAGQAKTVTLDLMPGLYEVSCTGGQSTDRQGTDQQRPDQDGTDQLGADQEISPMLVMVTEDASLGGTTPDAQSPAQPGSSEPTDADNLDTDNE